MKSVVKLLGILFLPLIMVACSSSSPDVIKRDDAQRLSRVEDAVVLSVRPVTVDGSQSGIGATVGGVVGAVGGYAGSSVQREGQILGVLAGVAGAAAGNVIERYATREEAVEILLQLSKTGERRAVVQAKSSESLLAGDSVIIVTTGSKVRVSRAPK